MRSPFRTIAIVTVAASLLAVFLRNVDLQRVGAEITRAKPEWLAFVLMTALSNLVIRAYRWQYLLEPLGRPDFMRAFRATTVGFAASAILPARAGEVIRPYFLTRTQPDRSMSTSGAFATIILERLLDILTVIVLLAAYVFAFERGLGRSHPAVFEGLKWTAATAASAAIAGLVALFVMAGHPERLGASVQRLAHVLPAKLAGIVAGVAERFALGLGVIRRPSRLAIALALSFPLWLSIAAGIWGIAHAFAIRLPFAGSFLIMSLLTLGVAVPTPGGVGGYHAAYRYGATFFDARDEAAVGAAIVAHLFSIVPPLVLGLWFAAREGLSVVGLRHVADEVGQGGTISL